MGTRENDYRIIDWYDVSMYKRLLRPILRLLNWRTQQRLMEFREIFRRQHGDSRFDYRLAEVRTVAKHNAPTLVVDRLLRYQAALGHEIDFEGKTVLEVGAGPVLGWALTGLSKGATRYIVLDPSFNSAVLGGMERYFEDQRRWLATMFGEIDGLKKLLDQGRIQIIRANGEHTELPDSSVDLVLSNSVIEHVMEMDALVNELHRIVAPSAIQYHFVDFTDHRTRDDRFTHLYPYHPDEIRGLYRRRGLHLNMLRPTDVKLKMEQRFAVTQTSFLTNAESKSARNAHPWWHQHYTPADLAIEVAAFELREKPLTPDTPN